LTETLYFFIEIWRTCFQFLLENNTAKKRKTACLLWSLKCKFSLHAPTLQQLLVLVLCFDQVIDPMHKWLPIKNSFVIIKISPTNLVLELIIQKNFYSQTRLVGLILIITKEYLLGSHLCIGSIVRQLLTNQCLFS